MLAFWVGPAGLLLLSAAHKLSLVHSKQKNSAASILTVFGIGLLLLSVVSLFFLLAAA